MNSFDIALNNFKNNLREYGLYMAAMIASVMVYYNFAALEYNPEVLKSQAFVRYATTASQVASLFLLIFLVFFTWYSNSFFFSRRKKEIGIYIFLGIDNRRIALVFAIETILQGLAAVAAGLLLGFLAAKLFMMALAKVVLLGVSVDYFFSIKSVQKTVLVFLSIFGLISIKNYFEISRSRLVDLMNFARKEEKPPASSIVRAALSILLIAAAYVMCLAPGFITLQENFFVVIIAVVILTAAGTMLLFSSFFPLAVQRLLHDKSLLYRGTNLVTLSSIAFRIRRIYRTLAVVALMIACSLTALSTSLSLRYYIEETHDMEAPYSFTYINERHDPSLQDKVRALIEDYGHEILLEEHATLLFQKEVRLHDYNRRDAVILAYEDFARIITRLQVKNHLQLIEELKPRPGQAVYVEKPGTVIGLSSRRDESIDVGGVALEVTRKLKIPLLGSGVPVLCLVVDRQDFSRMQASLQQFEFYGFSIDNPQDAWDLTMDLKSISPLNQGLYSYAEAFADKYEYIGIFYFLGVFLSLIYFLATGSILYFKILSDAVSDKEKYRVLAKIGMTQDELYRTLFRQVGVLFALPLLAGVIHSVVAVYVLHGLMSFNLVAPTAFSICLFLLLYGGFFWFTVHKNFRLLSAALDKPAL